MARAPKTADASAPAKPRAPQKRVLHIFYAPKADGNGIEIINVMSDARKVIEFMDSAEYLDTPGIKRYKHEVISEPRGGSDDAEETATAE